MTTRYLNSANPTPASPYDTKATAATSINDILTDATNPLLAGETILHASTHSEVLPTTTYNMDFPGTPTAPNKLISINWTTDAYEKATSSNFDQAATGTWRIGGSFVCYGSYWKSNTHPRFSDGSTSNRQIHVFDGATLEVYDRSRYIRINRQSWLVFRNGSTINWSEPLIPNAGMFFDIAASGCGLLVIDSTITTADSSDTTPQNLINYPSYGGFTVFFDNVDMSGISCVLYNLSANTRGSASYWMFRNVKMNANSQIYPTQDGHDWFGLMRDTYHVDTSNKRTRENHSSIASFVGDTGVYRTAASAIDGTQQSINVITNGTSHVASDTTVAMFDLWSGVVDMSTSKTFTVEFVQDDSSAAPTALTNADIWIEVSYEHSTDVLKETLTSKVSDPITTPTAYPSSSEAWTGLLAFSTKQKMSVTSTVAGDSSALVTVRLCVAKDGLSNLYVDPDVTIT